MAWIKIYNTCLAFQVRQRIFLIPTICLPVELKGGDVICHGQHLEGISTTKYYLSPRGEDIPQPQELKLSPVIVISKVALF